jgi:glutamine amidotransferase
VNSYHAVPSDAAAVLATTQYSVPFCSMLAAGNVAATQFHAEKSGEIGLRLLRNFAGWDGDDC